MEKFPGINSLIDMALGEDVPETGDVTSEAIFADERDAFRLYSKANGILCGTGVFDAVMHRLDPAIAIRWNYKDGDAINEGAVLAEVSGKVISILKAERTALNFLSIMSAVSTRTALFVNEAAGKLVVLDTRKTIPGMRLLQKYAVVCGGGRNHRMGLYDMVMIKDNHIDAAGGITGAVKKVRSRWGNRYRIEIETRDLDEVKEALACGADRIMLDNMDEKEMASAVKLINGACETEASGNMTVDKISRAVSAGVDYISAGELTNSIKAFDFSLKKTNKLR
jgi:nicotinate-nucleotide pyrophosphorylase (carboxylating)